MPAATASNDGYMPKEAFSKLDGIDPGANANVASFSRICSCY